MLVAALKVDGRLPNGRVGVEDEHGGSSRPCILHLGIAAV